MSTVKTFSKGIEEFENWVNICLVGNQIQVTGFQLIHDEDDQVGEKNDYDVDIDEDECEDGGDTKDKTYQEKPQTNARFIPHPGAKGLDSPIFDMNSDSSRNLDLANLEGAEKLLLKANLHSGSIHGPS